MTTAEITRKPNVKFWKMPKAAPAFLVTSRNRTWSTIWRGPYPTPNRRSMTILVSRSMTTTKAAIAARKA
jgi:hypothetical protein